MAAFGRRPMIRSPHDRVRDVVSPHALATGRSIPLILRSQVLDDRMDRPTHEVVSVSKPDRETFRSATSSPMSVKSRSESEI